MTAWTIERMVYRKTRRREIIVGHRTADVASRERPRRAPSRSRARHDQRPLFRGDLQPTGFGFDEQFVPALRALAHADLEADEFLLAFRRRADQHQHAFAVVFHASLQEDAVRPHDLQLNR